MNVGGAGFATVVCKQMLLVKSYIFMLQSPNLNVAIQLTYFSPLYLLYSKIYWSFRLSFLILALEAGNNLI